MALIRLIGMVSLIIACLGAVRLIPMIEGGPILFLAVTIFAVMLSVDDVAKKRG